MIPDWQFSSDPLVNININPHVKIPVEWANGQLTVQPVTGLGITMAHWQPPRADLGAGIVFDSWAIRNRKWLVIGGLGLMGLAALAGLGVVLR